MTERTYPRHVHRRGGVYRVIEDAATDQQAQAAGWVDHPPNDWPVPDVYVEWDGTEPTPDVTKPARGRPRKTET